MEVEEKLARYKAFWNLEPGSGPLLGVDCAGFFPFERFAALRGVPDGGAIRPETLDPEGCLADYAAIAAGFSGVDDDFIRGVSPIPAVPWLEAMFGCGLRRSGGGVWADERRAGWEELEGADPSGGSPWRRRYLDFVRALTRQAAGRWPVGLPILRGVSDCLAALRGHEQSVVDCLEEPERSARLARTCADALVDLTRDHHRAAGPFHGGTFIEQYSLWAPGPLVRLQEDATALFSPAIFREVVLEEDRRAAAAFPYSLLHLHGSSLFLVEEFLSIREIGVYEVNRDVGAMDLESMLPYLERIQEDGRRLYLRGPFEEADFRLMAARLSPVGLAVQPVAPNADEGRRVLAAARRAFGR